MSGSINVVMLLGNLGRDPDLKYASNGNAVCNFSVAVNESWTDKGSGERKERTEWVRVTCWGKTAESAGEHLRKGSQVHVEGKLQTREYTDKDGNKRSVTEVVADRVTFLGARESDTEPRGKPASGPQHRTKHVGRQEEQPGLPLDEETPW